MRINFIKMQAQGNDFVILDLRGLIHPEFDPEELARDICDRRFGVGADGLVLLSDSIAAAARMLIYNADGSRALMCGSALRCVTDLLHSQTGMREALIETDSGVRQVRITADGTIEVSLGRPEIVNPGITVEGVTGCLVNVGNYHFVCFGQSHEKEPHLLYGPVFEQHQQLPGAVNTHFVHLVSRDEISIKIWEHGVGPTHACGTGAAASVLCGRQRGLLSDRVLVNMPGGSVSIAFLQDGECVLGGRVALVYEGEYRWKT